MSRSNAIVLILVILMIVLYIQQTVGSTENTKSTFDNKTYLVQNLSDKQDAADYIAKIAGALSKLVRHMAAKYPNNDDVKRMYARFDPSSISEGSIESGYTSYSVDKGRRIVLCIRQGDKTFVDFNTMLYVAIHEIAHVMTLELDHPPQFWINFKFLLEEAMILNIYSKRPKGSSEPIPYCGISINNTIA